jgi:hypothetical protein
MYESIHINLREALSTQSVFVKRWLYKFVVFQKMGFFADFLYTFIRNLKARKSYRNGRGRWVHPVCCVNEHKRRVRASRPKTQNTEERFV